MYIVGHLIHFTNQDPIFRAIEEAIDHALEQSVADDEGAYAVWIKDTGECLAIAYEGELYRK